MKNYNEQLNEQGTSAFVMKKTIDKDNNVKKAFIYCPAEKVSRLVNMLDNKGGNNTPIRVELGDSMVLVRNNNICGVVRGGKVYYGNYKNQGYTARGIRLNEKHIEGLIDYAKTFGKVEKPEVVIDDSLNTIKDSFKTTAATLTIDDLLSL